MTEKLRYRHKSGEIDFLRRNVGLTLLDMILNTEIRENLGV
ncbi:unnamed protein product [Soboliphyme baturini]|uniref:DUF4277 domain-containing protein n=1 Tax=Soboliphyme baturini TaxID=241478 RepID=A0A183J5E0_9BILA|nr:unnamed protein product [Soboliphyme baturini]